MENLHPIDPSKEPLTNLLNEPVIDVTLEGLYTTLLTQYTISHKSLPKHPKTQNAYIQTLKTPVQSPVKSFEPQKLVE